MYWVRHGHDWRVVAAANQRWGQIGLSRPTSAASGNVALVGERVSALVPGRWCSRSCIGSGRVGMGTGRGSDRGRSHARRSERGADTPSPRKRMVGLAVTGAFIVWDFDPAATVEKLQS